MNKGLSTIWAILIILVVAILVGGSLYWYITKTSKEDSAQTQTTTQSSTSNTIDTSGWKTGQFNAVTYKYPTTWSFEYSPESGTDIVYLKTDKNVPDNTGAGGADNPIEIKFEIIDPQKTTLEDSVIALSQTGEGFLLANKKTQKIDTIDGLRYTITLANQSKDDTVFLLYQQKLYKITVFSNSILTEKNLNDIKPYFDKVLGTIKLGTAPEV